MKDTAPLCEMKVSTAAPFLRAHHGFSPRQPSATPPQPCFTERAQKEEKGRQHTVQGKRKTGKRPPAGYQQA